MFNPTPPRAIHRPRPGEVEEARLQSDLILKRARKLLRETTHDL